MYSRNRHDRHKATPASIGTRRRVFVVRPRDAAIVTIKRQRACVVKTGRRGKTNSGRGLSKSGFRFGSKGIADSKRRSKRKSTPKGKFSAKPNSGSILFRHSRVAVMNRDANSKPRAVNTGDVEYSSPLPQANRAHDDTTNKQLTLVDRQSAAAHSTDYFIDPTLAAPSSIVTVGLPTVSAPASVPRPLADRRWLTRVCTLMLLASIVAAFYVVEPLLYLVFAGLNTIVVRSILWKNFSVSYAFLSAFVVLGNWLKVTVHAYFDYPFVEPVGSFAGEASTWEQYYHFATTNLLAMLVARTLMSWARNVRSVPTPQLVKGRSVHPNTWLLIIICASIFYAINSLAGFFVTGVEPTVVLPASLNAVFAFIALIGLAVFTAWKLSDELNAKGRLGNLAMVCLLTQSIVASLSLASRAAVVMHVVPVLLVLLNEQRSNRNEVFPLRIVVGSSIALVLSLIGVSLYRINTYYGAETFDPVLIESFVNESLLLFVDRWVGLESTLAAVSSGISSYATFVSMLLEDPRAGVDGIYQLAANSNYRYTVGRAYLTLPGVFAILAFSGSLVLTFIGTLFCVWIARIIEAVAAYVSGRRGFVVAVCSAGVTNSLVQMSYPKLLLPFLFFLVVTLFILRLVYVRRV